MSFVDVFIVGGGPSGLSAALTLIRENHSGSLCELQPFKCFAAVDGGLKATDKNGETYQGNKVILANGVAGIYPDIPGYAECWGKGIVTIYTNGNEELVEQITPTIKGKPWTPDTRKIAKLALKSPEDTAVEITFEDGSIVTEAFLGHSPVTRLSGPFTEQLGLRVSQMGSEYETSVQFQATNVPGVYAAGDAMNMFKVLSNRVASGAQAAAGVAVKLQEEKWGLHPVHG
ncbi:hypothetical protein GGR52DRAFT_585427 [Hypoxylon sp. FL1284]|nr:hypothetical protein GGR52DRAFT_585427 [Hypoxylon sp. FL1284]